MAFNLKYIFMINKIEDPDFVASWQKVEEALKRLDENQVDYPHEESKIE